MREKGKRYRQNLETIDREELYSPAAAVGLIKGFTGAKFDETVEVHVRTGLNVRHADQQLRGTISLPHGLGKEMTVAVFAKGDKAREAEEAGADHVGAEDLAEKVEGGFTDFDVAIATPDMMPVVGKLGRILGPQGKMPNPKVGTVTMDVSKAVSESKAGKIEYRTDRKRDRAPADRQAELRRAHPARELRRADRRDHAGQARGGEGPLPELGHAHHQHGAGREGRPVAHARHRGGAGGGSLTGKRFCPRPPASK